MPIDSTATEGKTKLTDGFVEDNGELAICAVINLWNMESQSPTLRCLVPFLVLKAQLEALAKRLGNDQYKACRRAYFGADNADKQD